MCLRLKGKQSTGEQNNSRWRPDPVAVTKGSRDVHHFRHCPIGAGVGGVWREGWSVISTH